MDAGMDGHLAKPIDIDILLETLDNIFECCSTDKELSNCDGSVHYRIVR